MRVVVGGMGVACRSHAEHNNRYNTSTSTDAVNGTMTLYKRRNRWDNNHVYHWWHIYSHNEMRWSAINSNKTFLHENFVSTVSSELLGLPVVCLDHKRHKLYDIYCACSQTSSNHMYSLIKSTHKSQRWWDGVNTWFLRSCLLKNLRRLFVKVIASILPAMHCVKINYCLPRGCPRAYFKTTCYQYA